MDNFFNKFSIGTDKEDLRIVIGEVEKGVVFRGTNLWILIFAIFIASLGLNVNSTAVIIGAMLISPLMGPIIGIGIGIGINDVSLFRKAAYNYFVATGTALATSTLFFFVSPLSEAHSEILARTSPNIYDVLIATFGGFAGIIATSSKLKGNVIPGVAIATALMPPLCTAGYGLATLQWQYFVGAFYLYVINTVFITWATLVVVRLFHFPLKHLQSKRADKIAHRILWLIVMVTFIPSVYFGYDIVQRDRFTRKANNFINNEAHFSNDYLLNKKIDAKAKSITLVFGGKEITAAEIENLQKALKKYELNEATLDVKQGFAYLSENTNMDKKNEQVEQLTQALASQEEKRRLLQARVDSLKSQELISLQVFKEMKSQYPNIKEAIIQPGEVLTDSSATKTIVVIADLSGRLSPRERNKLENWLKVRLNSQNLTLILK